MALSKKTMFELLKICAGVVIGVATYAYAFGANYSSITSDIERLKQDVESNRIAREKQVDILTSAVEKQAIALVKVIDKLDVTNATDHARIVDAQRIMSENVGKIMGKLDIK